MSDKTDTCGANSHVREMSVTERLRALLDERGVEWRPIAWNPKKETFYHTPDGVGFCADEYVDGVKIYTDALLTPEQAVAATLGPGTCHREWRKDGYAFCSECGYNITGPWAHYCPNCGRRVEK